MTKKFLISIIVISCILLTACGGGNKLNTNNPYTIVTKNFEAEITLTGATRTTLLDEWVEESKTSDIVMLELDIKPIEIKSNDFNSFDLWTNIRVCDEEGKEIIAFEYALPGDNTSIVMIDENETKSCTIPYQLKKNCRMIEVDIYQDTEYSNKIKLNIE